MAGDRHFEVSRIGRVEQETGLRGRALGGPREAGVSGFFTCSTTIFAVTNENVSSANGNCSMSAATFLSPTEWGLKVNRIHTDCRGTSTYQGALRRQRIGHPVRKQLVTASQI